MEEVEKVEELVEVVEEVERVEEKNEGEDEDETDVKEEGEKKMEEVGKLLDPEGLDKWIENISRPTFFFLLNLSINIFFFLKEVFHIIL